MHHIAADLRGFNADGRACDEGPWRWLAKPYRFGPLLVALLDGHRAGPAAGRHPDSPLWEAVYGCAIPGHTWQEQRRQVVAWAEEGLRDPTLLQKVLFGTAVPSALEGAVGVGRWATDWMMRLTETLTVFDVQPMWPLGFLDPEVGAWDRTAP
jgi:hypothetical protein